MTITNNSWIDSGIGVSEMAWSRLRIRNQTFEASLESESDSTPLGTWLSGIGVGINYCWVEVESESTPADRNQLQVCLRPQFFSRYLKLDKIFEISA